MVKKGKSWSVCLREAVGVTQTHPGLLGTAEGEESNEKVSTSLFPGWESDPEPVSPAVKATEHP